MREKKTRNIYTVSKLTQDIKILLEETFPFVWVTGEISNHSVPASGHSYFTIKDSRAVISCVMFKNQKSRVNFKLVNGMNIFGLARLTLYEPRGSYQLIFEHLEPEGAGAAQAAFEKMKKKLSDQGYFDKKFKKPIPYLASRITVITSGTGAAVQDIMNIRKRRFPGFPVEIISVKVQGLDSDREIASALKYVNINKESDLIILARGGGSLEDLAAFNSEITATAIFESDIPLITGIGHETDFTIADFTADLRAPTPSAAAELAFQDKNKLLREVLILNECLETAVKKLLKNMKSRTYDLKARLKTPETMIYDGRLRLEELSARADNIIKQYFKIEKKKVLHLYDKLNTLNPENVLKRGYSIARFAKDKKVIFNSNSVKEKDEIEVMLHKGSLITEVKKTDAGKNV